MHPLDDPIAAALLQGILANPDDMDARLVYADRLEEIGESDQSRFIRVQMTTDNAPLTYELRGSAPRGERLVSGGHGFDWLWLRRFLVDHLHRFPSISGTLTFRHGFIEDIVCRCDGWLAHADAILAAHPVRRVTITESDISTGLHWDYLDSDMQIVYFKDKGPEFEYDQLPGEYGWVLHCMIAARWPGIKFTFTDPVQPETISEVTPG
jgi:uncharacterized protein (TIGR02996 family)